MVEVSRKKPGATASILTSTDGGVEGIEFNGYLGKGVTVEQVKKMARDIEASVLEILQKLVS